MSLHIFAYFCIYYHIFFAFTEVYVLSTYFMLCISMFLMISTGLMPRFLNICICCICLVHVLTYFTYFCASFIGTKHVFWEKSRYKLVCLSSRGCGMWILAVLRQACGCKGRWPLGIVLHSDEPCELLQLFCRDDIAMITVFRLAIDCCFLCSLLVVIVLGVVHSVVQ